MTPINATNYQTRKTRHGKREVEIVIKLFDQNMFTRLKSQIVGWDKTRLWAKSQKLYRSEWLWSVMIRKCRLYSTCMVWTDICHPQFCLFHKQEGGERKYLIWQMLFMKEEVKLRGIRRLARDVHTPLAKQRVKKESNFYPCSMLGEGNRPHCILLYWGHFFLLDCSEALIKLWAGSTESSRINCTCLEPKQPTGVSRADRITPKHRTKIID